MSTTTSPTIAVPGQRLGPVSELTAGVGTYVRFGQVFACRVGYVINQDNKVVEVHGKTKSSAMVPSIGSIVTGRIQRLNMQLAVVSILLVDDIPVNQEFEGIIRQENVRATERDLVEIPNAFVPGDIVRAQIISLGESASYILSTARNDLGVIYAHGRSGGHALIPISWDQMQCPITGAIESRKVCQVNTSATATT